MNQKKKTVLITGGSRGIGKEMAYSIAKSGLDIIITYHEQRQMAEAVVENIKALGVYAACFQLDTSKPDQFDAFIVEVSNYLNQLNGSPNFDYLINNAGTAFYASYTDVIETDIDKAFMIHYKGPFMLTQKMLANLNDGGGIINVSSGLARFSIPGSSLYASMKAAIEVLTRYQAKELGKRAIRANVIAPGAIETDFGNGHVRDDKKVNQMVAGMTALGRAGLATDIGGVAAFLCSDAAYWVNGQRIEVSGGMVI